MHSQPCRTPNTPHAVTPCCSQYEFRRYIDFSLFLATPDGFGPPLTHAPPEMVFGGLQTQVLEMESRVNPVVHVKPHGLLDEDIRRGGR